jgi:hypothetical protein
MTDLTTEASKRSKIIAAALAFAAAAALGWASFSGEWAVLRPDGSASFGLRRFEACEDRDSMAPGDDSAPRCGSGSLMDIPDHRAFAIFGWIASVALWIAAASLAASAGLMLAGRFIARFVAPTTIALVGLAIGLVSGMVFLALKPEAAFGPGPAFWAFAGGSLTGIVATILVARIRPADPDWDDPEKFDEDKW